LVGARERTGAVRALQAFLDTYGDAQRRIGREQASLVKEALTALAIGNDLMALHMLRRSEHASGEALEHREAVALIASCRAGLQAVLDLDKLRNGGTAD
jgi:hypothetical protein